MFKNEDAKNGFETLIFENKEWAVIKRLGEPFTEEGFFMKVDIYRVKRKPEKGKTIKGFAVVTEMRNHKDGWSYWVEGIEKHRGDAELLFEGVMRKVAKMFSVESQYENHIKTLVKSMRE